MRIALIGYGKMGKEIEKISLQRGHKIVIKSNGEKKYNINDADIAIDFSTPTSAYKNIYNCISNNIPVISGTTGWLDKYNDIVNYCIEKKGSFIYASNFSIGVNIFFELNKHFAKMMNKLTNYNVSIKEIHHKKKLDAPSGTAITLAEGIIENTKNENWELNIKSNEKTIPIKAVRKSNIPGTHSISYKSEIDTIKIKHIAHNRQGFALGAVIAAEWLIDKKGIFTMKDVLNIN